MSDDNTGGGAFDLEGFREMFEEVQKKMAAVELFTKIVEITTRNEDSGYDSEEDAMSDILEAIVTYGDKRVLDAMSR